MNYSFTIQISGLDLVKDYDDILYDAGCDDALIRVVDEIMYLDFDRDAPSLSKAVKSAECDIIRSGGHIISIIE